MAVWMKMISSIQLFYFFLSVVFINLIQPALLLAKMLSAKEVLWKKKCIRAKTVDTFL